MGPEVRRIETPPRSRALLVRAVSPPQRSCFPASARGSSSKIRSTKPTRSSSSAARCTSGQLEAVDLYKDGWAPRIYVLREIADWGEARAHQARHPVHARSSTCRSSDGPARRAARIAISILDPANSTAEEADDRARARRRAKSSRRVIIVTSKQHTRRARLVMNRRLHPRRREGHRARQPLRSRERRPLVDEPQHAALHAVRNAAAVRLLDRRRGLAWRERMSRSHGSERGPVALPVFKIGRCPLEAEAEWRKRLGVEPSLPRKGAATDFEDREGHRAPFTSVRQSYQQREHRFGVRQIRQHVVRAGLAQLLHRSTRRSRPRSSARRRRARIRCRAACRRSR